MQAVKNWIPNSNLKQIGYEEVRTMFAIYVDKPGPHPGPKGPGKPNPRPPGPKPK